MHDAATDKPTDEPPGSASALSAVPAAGSGRGRFAGGIVKFFHGPMDCGKSTLALQLHYNHSRQGRFGLLLTKFDRSGPARISSRIGISRSATEIDDGQDIGELVRATWARGRRVDYLIVDEAQFFTAAQIDQLAALADDVQVDVYAFGIATDFRGRLFEGSARLFELADEVLPLQVEVLCWCGRIGRFNGRVVGGRIVREGATVVVADTGSDVGDVDAVRYQVLCRAHHRAGDLGPAASAGPSTPVAAGSRAMGSPAAGSRAMDSSAMDSPAAGPAAIGSAPAGPIGSEPLAASAPQATDRQGG